jgi:hypothetical protein
MIVSKRTRITLDSKDAAPSMVVGHKAVVLTSWPMGRTMMVMMVGMMETVILMAAVILMAVVILIGDEGKVGTWCRTEEEVGSRGAEVWEGPGELVPSPLGTSALVFGKVHTLAEVAFAAA